MEASTSNTNPACRYNSVLFRKNFFRFIDTDDKVMRAECLLCGDGTIRKTSARTTSNYVIHLKVCDDTFFHPEIEVKILTFSLNSAYTRKLI